MSELKINNEVFKVVQKLPPGPNAADRFIPDPPQLRITNASQLINQVNPGLIVKSFGIPMLATEIYKGRIPVTPKDESPILRKSALGTSIFSDLQFTQINGIGHVPVDTVLFNVYQDKHIVRTPINGRNGRIKEYAGEDDFEINIKGVICGTNGAYPWDHVKNLIYFLRYDQSLGVVSRFLNELFDITELVVYKYAFEQSEGSYSYQKFEIDAYSEKPVEILIQEANQTLPNIINPNATVA